MDYKTLRKVHPLQLPKKQQSQPNLAKALRKSPSLYHTENSLQKQSLTASKESLTKTTINISDQLIGKYSYTPLFSRNSSQLQFLGISGENLTKSYQIVTLCPKSSRKQKVIIHKSQPLSFINPLFSLNNTREDLNIDTDFLNRFRFKSETKLKSPPIAKLRQEYFETVRNKQDLIRPKTISTIYKSPPVINSAKMPKWYDKRKIALKSEYYRLNFAITKKQMLAQSGSRISIADIWKEAGNLKKNKFFSGSLQTKKNLLKTFSTVAVSKEGNNIQKSSGPLKIEKKLRISKQVLKNIKKSMKIAPIFPATYSVNKNSC